MSVTVKSTCHWNRQSYATLRVGFVVDNGTIGEGFPRALWFFYASVTPSVFHKIFRLSIHRRYIP